MDLKNLGYDDWFAARADALLAPGQSVVRVIAVDRGSYVVRDERDENVAKLSGKFRFEAGASPDLPCVGDWVCVDRTSPALAIIHAVLPRRTFLRRKCSGKTVDFQMIAANVDVAFIVQSCHFDFNVRRLDRYLVAAQEGQIEAMVLLSKTDLLTAEELAGTIDMIKASGISTPLLPLSNTTGSGVEELRALLAPGKTYCLLGSSGVGKTTLINRLIGRDLLETMAVSSSGEGVHTTSRRQLLMLDSGAMLIDTPGMRELGLLGSTDGLAENFSDFHELVLACRFANCTHTQEPGCAVLNALKTGEIDQDRYHRYLKLKKETAFYERSYVEKRKKDKNFGRVVKAFHKHGKHQTG